MLLLDNIVYMNYLQKIYTGGAGEGGGFLKVCCTAKAYATQVFEGFASKLIGC